MFKRKTREDDPVIVKLNLHIDSLDEGLTRMEIMIHNLEKQIKLLNEVNNLVVPVVGTFSIEEPKSPSIWRWD